MAQLVVFWRWFSRVFWASCTMEEDDCVDDEFDCVGIMLPSESNS